MGELINWARFFTSFRMTDNPRSISKIAAAQRTCLAMTLEWGVPGIVIASEAISNKGDDIDGRIARLKPGLQLAGCTLRDEPLKVSR